MQNYRNFVRDRREAAGLTREALARKIGCGVTTIVQIERGEMRLSDVWIYRIAEGLGCYPADLLDGGPERLTPRDRTVLDIFRTLSPEDQDRFIKLGAVLAQPSTGQRQGNGDAPRVFNPGTSRGTPRSPGRKKARSG